MSKTKKIFDGMLIFFLILGAWFLITFCMQMNQFLSRSRFVKLESASYYLLETPLKRIRVGADFTYLYKNKQYGANYVFNKNAFLNEYGAREWIEGKKLISPYVYINPKSPSKGVLERAFPWKSGLQLMLILIALAYFSYLKNYVLRYV